MSTNSQDTIVNELNSLDFSTLIGGPMQAAVTAQNNASLAQVEFIKSVGIVTEAGTNKLSEVTFMYNDSSTNTKKTITAPVLALLNIPSLRIDEMTIDFNAKITSVETKNVDTTATADGSLSLSYGKLVNLKATASYKKTSSSGSQVDKSYSMTIHVKVVNDDIPAGLDRMISLIEGNTTLN